MTTSFCYSLASHNTTHNTASPLSKCMQQVNPDGFVYSMGKNRMWRKNRCNIAPVPSVTLFHRTRRQNSDGSFGVDLNRVTSFRSFPRGFFLICSYSELGRPFRVLPPFLQFVFITLGSTFFFPPNHALLPDLVSFHPVTSVMLGRGEGSSNTPSSDIYHGPNAFSVHTHRSTPTA